MAVLEYYTDGSIKIDYMNYFAVGRCGYVSIENGILKESNIIQSYPHIHYLEALAIHYVLMDISNKINLYDQFKIYTDSDTVYKELTKKRLYYKMDIYEYELFECLNLLNYLKDLIQIKLICIKSHCGVSKQIIYQKTRYNNVISSKEAKQICDGNNKIDQLVNQNYDPNLETYIQTPFYIQFPTPK